MKVLDWKYEGTTSACAENTWTSKSASLLLGNYLRMRGEYQHPTGTTWGFSELPPHARRIPAATATGCAIRGTTSACAENTLTALDLPESLRNYLRMRGEYFANRPQDSEKVELPPHARRIRCEAGFLLFTGRTTSACAENTLGPQDQQISSGNYLRMRGEYPK